MQKAAGSRGRTDLNPIWEYRNRRFCSTLLIIIPEHSEFACCWLVAGREHRKVVDHDLILKGFGSTTGWKSPWAEDKETAALYWIISRKHLWWWRGGRTNSGWSYNEWPVDFSSCVPRTCNGRGRIVGILVSGPSCGDRCYLNWTGSDCCCNNSSEKNRRFLLG